MGIYSDVKTSLREKKNEVEKLLHEIDKLEDDKKNGHRDQAYISGVIDPGLMSLRMRITGIKDNALLDVQKLVNQHKDSLQQLNKINGADLTEDVKLFTCGVKLTSKEIEDLIDRNSNNPTMVQLALRYAHDNGIKVNRAYNNHTEEIRECDNFYQTAELYVRHWIDKANASEMLDKFYPEG